jgi:hypothetical protein
MCKAFPFQLSPEATSDENLLGKRPIFSLLLATVLQISVGRSPGTKPRVTGPHVVKLVASGIPDTGVLSGVETNHKAFDVSPASVLNVKQALVASSKSLRCRKAKAVRRHAFCK